MFVGLFVLILVLAGGFFLVRVFTASDDATGGSSQQRTSVHQSDSARDVDGNFLNTPIGFNETEIPEPDVIEGTIFDENQLLNDR